MSNPFDQFAADFQAALPAGAPGAAPPAFGNSPYDGSTSLMAQPPAPAAPKPPIMNTPMMNAPPGAPGGFGSPPRGGYGQQPPQYGMPQQSMGSMNGMGGPPNGMGGPPNGMGGPPNGMNMMASMNASQTSSLGGFGGFDPTQSTNSQGMPPYGAPPPPQGDAGNPFFGAPPPSAPPADLGNPFGAPAPDSSNPFGAPAAQRGYGAPPPDQGAFGAPPPPSDPSPFGAPPGQQPAYGAPPHDQGFGAPPQDQGPFGGPPSQPGYGAPPPPQDQGYGAPLPPQDQGYGAPPPPQDQYADPWGAPPAGGDPNMGALVPAQQQSNPYAGYAQPAPPQDYGYGAPPGQQPGYGPPPGQQPGYPGGPPPSQQPGYGPPPGQQLGYPGGPPPSNDPFGGYGAPPQQSQALTPYGGPPVADPFSVFEQQSKPPAPPAAAPYNQIVPAAPAPSDDNLWGDLGFDAPPVPDTPAPAPQENQISDVGGGHTEEKKTGDGSLPPGGEYYDARIFTPTLGVMFFKPQELTDSLFLNTDQSTVDGLGERPVVAFIVEGSSARAAGVELGHVLLKVNGTDVRNPKEASRLIKEGPRPLPLLFYVPNTDVVVAEGEHMVKYDTRETTAPNSAKDWKPKYVVIGGIIAQPWMMNMYRSKSEYDIAVIETQARRPVSVKVKQFSLQGARIQNDWQGPQMVKYKNKIHPWKYIVVLPVARNPIKISSPNLAQLKPVHEGIRRVLLAQNRDRSYNSHAPPIRQGQQQRGGDDQYGGHNGHNEYHHQQQMQQHHGQQAQYNY